MKGRDALIILGLMLLFYFTVGALGGDYVDAFIGSDAFYGWLVVKNVLTWFCFLFIGIYIGRVTKK